MRVLQETRRIKGLCYKIEQKKDTWVTGVPILTYSEYSVFVKQIEGVTDLDVTDRLITAATIDLHDMGVVSLHNKRQLLKHK